MFGAESLPTPRSLPVETLPGLDGNGGGLLGLNSLPESVEGGIVNAPFDLVSLPSSISDEPATEESVLSYEYDPPLDAVGVGVVQAGASVCDCTGESDGARLLWRTLAGSPCSRAVIPFMATAAVTTSEQEIGRAHV